MKPSPPLRPTGLLERLNIARNYIGFYNSLAVTATYLLPRALLPSAGIADADFERLVYGVLGRVVGRHAALGICVVDEGGRVPSWRKVESFDLRELVRFVDADGDDVVSDGWLEAAHRQRLDRNEELPMWRVVVSRGERGGGSEDGEADDVVFGVAVFFHHAIADGVSGGAFHVSFLEALNEVVESKEVVLASTSVITPPSLPLLPPVELATPLPVTTSYLIKKVFTTYIYSPPSPRHWNGPAILASTPKPPIAHLKSFVISAAPATDLIAACRREKTTVTALVTALIARRLAEMYPTHSRFTAAVPWSLRKFTAISNREIALYISNAALDFSCEEPLPKGYVSCRSSSSSDLWDSARTCKAQLAAATASTNNQLVGMIGYIADLPKFFQGQVGSRRAYAFEVTNIGVFDGNGESRTKARFERIQFSTGLSTIGEPYAFLLATAKGGDMSFSLCWEEGVVEDEEALSLLAWLRKSLLDVIGSA